MPSCCCRIPIHVEELTKRIPISVEELTGHIRVTFDGPMYDVGVDVYDGPQDIIPSEAQQVLSTDNKKVVGDIVVEPIPDNYGRIAYSGAGLLVY